MGHSRGIIVLILTVGLISFLVACGGGNSSGGNGGAGLSPSPPAAPTGLAAIAGDQVVALSWNASGGATSYHVKRGTVSGGPYTQVAAPSVANYSDTGLTDNTKYFYVVTAVNSNGESANSNEVSATPIAPLPGGGTSSSVHVTVDVLANRHAISPYVYGVNFPSNTAYITDSGATFVRWGGNASTRYNWLNFATNAAADWYFQNRPWAARHPIRTPIQFVTQHRGSGRGADHDDWHVAVGGERRQCE